MSLQPNNHANSQGAAPQLSLYEYVGRQLGRLAPGRGLEQENSRIQEAYEILCREPLGFPLGETPLEFSRINEDGTPFQYSLSIKPNRPSVFQFLSEGGIPGSSNAQRIAVSKDKVRALCQLFGVVEGIPELFDVLDRTAPISHRGLLADPGVAFWTGVGFLPGESPKLTVYING